MMRLKGNLTLSPQEDYVVIDTETTGLSINTCEIVEIAALKVINGQVIDTFQSLIKPRGKIPRQATLVNKINDEMVMDAPTLDSVMIKFLDFVSDSVLVGHNINSYDLNILYDASLRLFEIPLSNDFVDTMKLARHCVYGLNDYTLSSIAKHLEVEVKVEHRALDDCYTTYKCYEKLKRMECMERAYRNPSKRSRRPMNLSDKALSLRELKEQICNITNMGKLKTEDIIYLNVWIESNLHLSGNFLYDKTQSLLKSELTEEELWAELNQLSCPVQVCKSIRIMDLKDKVVCLTGDFEMGTKEEVETYLTNLGAICKKNIIKSTDVLIVGNLGNRKWSYGTYGRKVIRAKEMQEKGSKIMIVSEKDIFCKEGI